jgi:hypothetical protein
VILSVVANASLMARTTTTAAVGAPDRRRAHLRVGAAATLAFLALLLLGVTRGPAIAPSQSAPVDPYPGFRHHHGFGGRNAVPGVGGGGTAPGPSTGGTET